MTKWVQTFCKKSIIAAAIGITAVLTLFVVVVEAPVSETQDVKSGMAEKRVKSTQEKQACFQEMPPISHQSSAGGIAFETETSSMSVAGVEAPPEAVAEEEKVPFFYEIHSEKIGRLSAEQQDSLLRVEEQFVEFYRTNPSAYYNNSLWTNEIANLRARIIDAIGIDAFETLMR